jgi:hypothetical protein
MTDPLDNELRQLVPAPLPARVQRRLDEIGAAPPWFVVRWPVWATALVTVVVMVGLRSWTVPPVLPAKVARELAALDCPPRVLRVLCSEREEGLVLINQTTPYRQVRRRYVELYTWDHCRTGTRLDYSVPAEEVVLTPVAVY